MIRGSITSSESCRQVHGWGGWGEWTRSLEMRVSRNKDIKELYGHPCEQWWLWEHTQRGDRCQNLGRWLKVSIMVLRSGWINCISHSTISIKPPKVIHVVVVVMVRKISTCTRDHAVWWGRKLLTARSSWCLGKGPFGRTLLSSDLPLYWVLSNCRSVWIFLVVIFSLTLHATGQRIAFHGKNYWNINSSGP